MRSARQLLDELNAVDESTRIEAKSGSGIGRSILETVSAFSNEPNLGGGYLLLGVARAGSSVDGAEYEVQGVADPDKVQADLASQCASTLNTPVRPRIAVEQVDGRTLIAAFIPEAAPANKPVYIRSRGLPKGAYRRIGSTDQSCSEDDLITLYTRGDFETFDASVVADGDLDDLSEEAVAEYRTLRERANPGAEELSWSDADFLRAIGAVRRLEGVPKPTVAGVLLFGTSMALRRCFPMMRIDYIRIPGKDWVADPDKRFDTLEIRAPILVAVRRAVAAITDDLLKTFALSDDQVQSQREFQLPVRAVREAVVNAVMHRSYRIHSPIQILRYSNRLEIRNPGHSLKSEDALGEPGSETRNPKIAAVLHDVNFAETKGSGIRVMRELMHQHGLIPPTFESTRAPDQFKACLLLHNLLEEVDLAWARTLTPQELTHEDILALVFVREVGAIDNSSFRNISGLETLPASARLRRLRDLQLLEKRGGGSATHYVSGPSLESLEPGTAHRPHGGVEAGSTNQGKRSGRSDPHRLSADPHQLSADPHQLSADPHQLSADPHQLGAGSRNEESRPENLRDLVPEELRKRLPVAGSRPRRTELRELIAALCAWRPLGSEGLATLLGGRDKKTLVREHLSPMIEEGLLAYTIPNMVSHPDQKYATRGTEDGR